jgi:hypothetical protein
MKWAGRVTGAEGDLFTAILTPADHEGPELIADFSMAQCGVEVEPGDLITVTAESVAKVDLGVWTQEEVDEVQRQAAGWSKWIAENVA